MLPSNSKRLANGRFTKRQRDDNTVEGDGRTPPSRSPCRSGSATDDEETNNALHLSRQQTLLDALRNALEEDEAQQNDIDAMANKKASPFPPLESFGPLTHRPATCNAVSSSTVVPSSALSSSSADAAKAQRPQGEQKGIQEERQTKAAAPTKRVRIDDTPLENNPPNPQSIAVNGNARQVNANNNKPKNKVKQPSKAASSVTNNAKATARVDNGDPSPFDYGFPSGDMTQIEEGFFAPIPAVVSKAAVGGGGDSVSVCGNSDGGGGDGKAGAVATNNTPSTSAAAADVLPSSTTAVANNNTNVNAVNKSLFPPRFSQDDIKVAQAKAHKKLLQLPHHLLSIHLALGGGVGGGRGSATAAASLSALPFARAMNSSNTVSAIPPSLKPFVSIATYASTVAMEELTKGLAEEMRSQGY